MLLLTMVSFTEVNFNRNFTQSGEMDFRLVKVKNLPLTFICWSNSFFPSFQLLAPKPESLLSGVFNSKKFPLPLVLNEAQSDWVLDGKSSLEDLYKASTMIWYIN